MNYILCPCNKLFSFVCDLRIAVPNPRRMFGKIWIKALMALDFWYTFVEQIKRKSAWVPACSWSGVCDTDKRTKIWIKRKRKLCVRLLVFSYSRISVRTRYVTCETKVRDKKQNPVLGFVLWNAVKEILCTCNTLVDR